MTDPTRRTILASAAAAAVSTASAVAAGAVTSSFQKGGVRIRYQEVGTGFPLLVTPAAG